VKERGEGKGTGRREWEEREEKGGGYAPITQIPASAPAAPGLYTTPLPSIPAYVPEAR